MQIKENTGRQCDFFIGIFFYRNLFLLESFFYRNLSCKWQQIMEGKKPLSQRFERMGFVLFSITQDFFSIRTR